MRKRAKAAAPANTADVPRRIVILALPPVDALDVIGPAEVFGLVRHLRGGTPLDYVVELVCPGPGLQVASETGIGLVGHKTLVQERQSDQPIDTLIVASGFSAGDAPASPDALQWIRDTAPSIRRVCSICVGAFVLAQAGILDGRRATTHWRMAQRLAEQYPQVRVNPEPIWIKDGNVYTSAGISSGIDLALSLVSEDLGDDTALQIAKNLVLYLRRPGGQAQYSMTLQSQQTTDSSLDALCVWIGENLHASLTVDILAERLATSVRTTIRLFQRELDTTPARYVEDVRLEAARRALELGARSMDEVARQCGYYSVDVLRKVFVRRLGITPKDYARQFSRVGTGAA